MTSILVTPVEAQQDHAASHAVDDGQEHAQHPAAPEAFSAREASGTAWLPDATPMYGWHSRVRGWDLMAHGNAFAQFLFESGEIHHRSHQAGSINWMMGMAARALGPGRLGVRTMFSLEPWTIRGCGYPNLLATGEICRRDSIHDRQHPHDLFMEVAAEYDHPLTGTLRWQVYGGPAGEPALGPAGFPHRLSAFPNPIAPIAHHWLDSTHITFGVVTVGLYDRRWKIEGSAFNGREPNPVRTNFDLGPLDSIASRLSVNPTDRLALQVSAGHLRDAEAGVGSLPRHSVDRATASASYHRPLGNAGIWATTLAWGVNSETSIIPGGLLSQTTHAALVEMSAMPNDRHSWFSRIEIVGKPADDLHAHEYITRVFTVGKLEAGYIRHFEPWHGLVSGVGGSVSAAVVPSLLAPRYRGRVAPGFGVFLSLQPVRHAM